MRIRTCPDFKIQCILYGKQQNPDCAVRIAVERALCFSFFLALHIECKDKRHYGNVIDGGWDACVSEPFRPAVNDCLVYSFGSVTSAASINRLIHEYIHV